MQNQNLNTSDVKLIFDEAGVSVAEWARVNGFSTTLVYQVLDGKRKCLRGQSHQIALALGIKKGTYMDAKQLSKKLRTLSPEAERRLEECKM
ncbi:MAG: DNA-binding protein [Methylotenera sp.]|jgi:gp16 family phage-associated protein|uniref:DNA-binding protein n=1 Tax=Methylotenera TaxID=359407 RepID=UPI000379EB73|nr:MULTISPECIES: DNA-binding protein [Methylotenera]MDP3777551.1 DNA-binding protein [Methylotenera sp.]PPC97440.1 MAG: DNA-binding protein [Methylotenera sp.]PPC98701.1 MAG: DNA-binding protein [Methylotenera sp.]